MKWDRANCMGYALRKNRWMTLEGFHWYSIEKMADAFACRYGLKRVRRSDMKEGKEYIVMRIGDGDFHFARRSSDGHWRHKPGHLPVEPISEKDVFDSSLRRRYTSTPIVFEV